MEKSKLSDTTVTDEKLLAIRSLVDVIDRVDTLRADCPSESILDSLNDLEKFAREKLHEWTTCDYCCGWDEDE